MPTCSIVLKVLGFLSVTAALAGPEALAAGQLGSIRTDDNVTQEQLARLHRDRQTFSKFVFAKSESNEKLRAMLGLKTLDPEQFVAWLEARVSVIVGEQFRISKNIFVLKSDFVFPNHGLFPDHEVAPPEVPVPGSGIAAPAAVTTIMSNLGTGQYESSKKSGFLRAARIPGLGVLPITSPRVGLIKVGEGLFTMYAYDRKRPDSTANAIRRLSTLFHEARHSDGNGKSLGFLHSVCPPEHDLHGRYSCDRTTNGSYRVSFETMRAMRDACTDCSIAEREALDTIVVGLYYRLLPTQLDGTPVRARDARPEGFSDHKLYPNDLTELMTVREDN